jgi:hypothetical protein
VKSLLPPSAAEYSFERDIIFEISRSEISKMMSLSKYYLALRVELCFVRRIIFTISRSEIVKMMCLKMLFGAKHREKSFAAFGGSIFL